MLTKALGTGLVLTASKRDLAEARRTFRPRSIACSCLNRHASHLAREAGATAFTDVTGYAITGHALEIAATQACSLPSERQTCRCCRARLNTQ